MPTTALVECQFQEYVPDVNCATDCANGCLGVRTYIQAKRKERQEKAALNAKSNPPLLSSAQIEAHNEEIARANVTRDIQYRGERVRDHETDREATGKP